MKPNIILAQGGGFRMIEAMAGVLIAIDEMGFKIDFYKGASAGGILCCFHASGMSGLRIADLIKRTEVEDLMYIPWYQKLKLLIPKWKVDWMYNRDGMEKFIRSNINEVMTKQKVQVSLTNAKTNETFMDYADGDSCMGTSAIPEIYKKYKVHGVLCKDGGLKNNIPMIPIDSIRDYQHIFILLCPQDIGEGKNKATTKTGRIIENFELTMEREVEQIKEQNWAGLENCVVIRPTPYKSSLLAWSNKKRGLIEHSYKCAKVVLEKFK